VRQQNRAPILIAILAMCMLEAAMSNPEAPDWVLESEHAQWAPRDSCGEVVHDGKMWLMAGWFDSNSIGPRDVWASGDGVNWTEVTHEAGWRHGDLPTTLTFNGRMWFMGGWYKGRLEGAGASNEVWSSTDGATWDCVTPNAAWSPRLAAAAVEFKGRMYLLGGIEQYFFGDDSHLRNDVWASADGENWECVTETAPWAPRAYHAAVVFNDRIYVFGGGNYLPGYKAFNDVWCSEDGANWTCVTEHAPWHERIWFQALVYRGCLWLLGGWSNEPSRNWNDVWYTADGVNWKEFKTKTIWSERHEHSCYVFDDRIWLVAGNAWPLVNDVWSLGLPPDWAGQE
jgi:hypothetical protein